MCGIAFARGLRPRQANEVGQRVLPGFAHPRYIYQCFRPKRTGICNQSLPGDIDTEVTKTRIIKLTAQIIAYSAGRLQSDVSDMRQGPTFDELLHVRRIFRARARDCPIRSPTPTLVPLTKFDAVPSPGQVPQIRAVVADDMNVHAEFVQVFGIVALRVELAAVAFLNHDVSPVLRIV